MDGGRKQSEPKIAALSSTDEFIAVENKEIRRKFMKEGIKCQEEVMYPSVKYCRILCTIRSW